MNRKFWTVMKFLYKIYQPIMYGTNLYHFIKHINIANSFFPILEATLSHSQLQIIRIWFSQQGIQECLTSTSVQTLSDHNMWTERVIVMSLHSQAMLCIPDSKRNTGQPKTCGLIDFHLPEAVTGFLFTIWRWWWFSQ